MSERGCQSFLQNPASSPGHLETCELCRDKAEALEVLGNRLGAAASVESSRQVAAELMEELPVAPWEGANHRAWVLVFGGAGIIVLFVAGAFSLLGISPVDGFVNAVSQTTIPRKNLIDISQSLVVLVQQASAGVQAFIGLSFVIVNVVFFFLLRRPPRGYDASSR